jgi:hypothetical protein
MNNLVERIAKTVPLILAGLYLVGFLIVALHLGRYGVSSLDLVKLQYLAAGFWFGCVFVVFYGFSTPLSLHVSEFIRYRAQGGFWRRSEVGALAGAIVTGPILIAVLMSLVRVIPWLVRTFGSSVAIELNQRVAYDIYSMRFLMLSVVGFDILLRVWLYLRAKARESSSGEYDTRYFWRLCTPFPVLAFLFCAVLFTRDVYPTISFSLGGGQPRQVVFWLGSGTTPDSFLERDGTSPYTVPYELLLETQNSLVVISPKDGQRAVEFDKKAVGAVVVLGKGPKPGKLFPNLNR